MKRQKNPWFKFFPTDWRADPALRMCSLSARGLWIEMLCIMHDAEGFLEINGIPVNERALASLSGSSIEEVNELLIVLKNAGVYSLDRKGRIYSRRITRDVKKARTAQKNGKNGGNPTLSKQRGNSPLVKGKSEILDKGEDKPQSPEARSQSKKELSKDSSTKDDEEPDFQLTPLPKKPPTEKTSSKRGTRLTKEWVPTKDDIAFAWKRGLNDGQISDETLKFRNYWISLAGQKGIKLDWPATWQNWIIKASEGYGRSSTNFTSSSGKRPRGGGRSEVFSELRGKAQEFDALSEDGGAENGFRGGYDNGRADEGPIIEG